jgi:hypothetical protein
MVSHKYNHKYNTQENKHENSGMSNKAINNQIGLPHHTLQVPIKLQAHKI